MESLEPSQLIPLLQAKNRCLERFRELSMEFLGATADGGFAALEAALPHFETGRDAIVKAIGLYERRIALIVQEIEALGSGQGDGTLNIDDSFRSGAGDLLREGETLLEEILALDERVVTRIEGGKADLQAQVNSHERSKTMARKFQSQWVPESGEEIDRKL